MALAAVDQRRALDGADVLRLPAPGAEPAARRRVGGAGHVALQQDPVLLTAQRRLVQRDRRQQRLRVGVRRRAVDLLLGALLDHAAQVHDRDPVGQVTHDRQVVGDEEIGHAELVLQVLEQVDDLGLHGDVERGDRLVADDDLRLEGERAGDPDALALAAGELVRIPVHVVGVEADALQQLLGALQPPLPGRDVGVHRPALGHDVADRHARVQRAVRVLEDDLDLAAVPLEGPAAHLGDVLTLVADRAAGRLLQRDQQLRDRRLAAAGLADHADRLTATQGRGRRRRRRGRGRPSS